MNVLFLALGVSRKPAVVEESARAVAKGDTVFVLVEDQQPWRRMGFDERVQMIDTEAVLRRHLPMSLEHLLVYRGPRFVMYRLLGRGRLRKPVRRAARAYERRIADRFHRSVFLPLYNRWWADARDRLVVERVREEKAFDWIVIADSVSIPHAVRIFDDLRRNGQQPGLVYSFDHVPV